MAGLGTGSNVVVNGAPGTNAEGFCAVSPILEVPRESQTLMVVATAKITVGTGATSATIRMRRGPSLGDVLLAFYTLIGVTPGVGQLFTMSLVDIVAGLATVQYGFTYQEVGASAGAAVNFANICVWAVL